MTEVLLGGVKKGFCLFLILFVFGFMVMSPLSAKADYTEYQMQWKNLYNTGYQTYGPWMGLDNNKNLIVGITLVKDSGNYMRIIKIDPQGNQTLLKEVLVPYIYTSVNVDKENNIILAGVKQAETYKDIFITKLDSVGNELWSNTFDYGGRDNVGNVVAFDSQNNIIFGGKFNDSGAEYDDDYYVIKLDPNGNLIWQTQYATNGHDKTHGITVDNEDNIIQIGQSPYYGLNAVKYDKNGNFLWSKTYHTGSYGAAYGVVVDEQNNIYLTGYYSSSVIDSCGRATHNTRTMKLSSNGNILWVVDRDSGCSDIGRQIAMGPDGNLYVLAIFDNHANNSIIIYDINGNFLYQMEHVGGDIHVSLINIDTEGNIYLSGIDLNTSYLTVLKYSIPPSNYPPLFDFISEQITQEGQTLSFTVSATDPNAGDVLTYSVDNLPEGASFNSNTGEFVWMPNYEQAGNYEVNFTVTDSGDPIELDIMTVGITVGDVNRPPVIEVVTVLNIFEGEAFNVIPYVYDPDGDAIILAMQNLPEGATFDASTYEFLWTPDFLDSGNHIITFTATDSGQPPLSSQVDVLITVSNVENPEGLTDDLIDDIISVDLPQEVENSYLANIKKVNRFIEQGKITPALNQLFALICKITEDVVVGSIDATLGEDFIFQAEQIILDLGGDPNNIICN